jgi:hypothetical protein
MDTSTGILLASGFADVEFTDAPKNFNDSPPPLGTDGLLGASCVTRKSWKIASNPSVRPFKAANTRSPLRHRTGKQTSRGSEVRGFFFDPDPIPEK